MVKDDTSYRKYDFVDVFGVIASRRSRVVYLPSKKGQLCAVGANENVIIWNLRTKEKHQILSWEAEGKKSCITRLAVQPDTPLLAVGYVDGTIRIFDWMQGSLEVTLSGHRSAITTFDFTSLGLLISGALDTTVIIWDVVAEAGLYRLKGHKAPVTQVSLLKDKNILISSSKDVTVKFWDLESQHCFLTLPDIHREVRSFALVNNQRRLLTLCSSADSEDDPAVIIIWDIIFYDEENSAEPSGPAAKRKRFDPLSENGAGDPVDLHILRCERRGTLEVNCGDLAVDPTGRLLVCFEKKLVEAFLVLTEEELKKKMVALQKKAGGKRHHDGSQVQLAAEDAFRKLSMSKKGRIPADVRSIAIRMETPSKAQLVCVCVNNSLLTLTADSKEGLTLGSGVTLPGHRGEARSVAVSSDSLGLLTAGCNEVKLWKRSDLQCLRTFPCRRPTCSLFAPGDQFAVIGCEDGMLHIFDLGSSAEESFLGHEGAVKSIAMSKDKRYVVTSGSDKMVTIWRFEFVTKEGAGKLLTLEAIRTYAMSYDIAVAKFSPKSKFLAVASRDSGVNARLYRFPRLTDDTEDKKLKLVHKLYSHSLPVTCMDFSYDDELLVTGAMDKAIKIWGTDFADVHRSLLAEQDMITAVQFLPLTHFFFSAGRDGSLKQWDADNFQRIRTLQGHFDPVNALAICPKGLFLLTCSRDNSVRVWERTSETFNLLEEREKEADIEDEETLVHEEETIVPGETEGETGVAARKNVESVKSTELLREAIELYKTETEKITLYEQERMVNKNAKMPEPDIRLTYRNMSALDYVRSVVMGIKANDLDDVLLSLPFSVVTDFLPILPSFYKVRREVDRADKCASFLFRIHHNQLMSCRELDPVLAELTKLQSFRSRQELDAGGFIMAGAQFLIRQLEDQEKVDIFAEFRRQKRRRRR